MGKISELSDELLVRILSFLPTKVAVSTSVLSKQWEYLWMWLPNLEFGSTHTSKSEFEKLMCFLLRNLPLHRAPFIQSFRLNIPTPHIKPEDVKLLVLFAVSRDVRELEIFYPFCVLEKVILPSSLYTCKFLVALKLEGCCLVDVPPMVCLPSLKTLRLQHVSYVNKDSLQRLLSNCPVLEDIFMFGFAWNDMGKLIVRVPSLQRLSLLTDEDLDEFVIDTPSLKYLKLDYHNHLYDSIKNMPKLREAFLWVSFPFAKRLMGSISSVKRLTLCLLVCNWSEVLCDDGFVFNKLKHLKLCLCQAPNVLAQLLKICPNLRSLELFVMDGHEIDGLADWNQPSIVPECMLSSLKTFKWSGYNGSEEESDIVIYILQNARRLKTATIFSEPNSLETLDMIKELALSSRASTTCQLVFH